MAGKIVGSLYWIENAKPTSKVVDVKEAFSDPAQARAQILYAEKSGDKRQLRLARVVSTILRKAIPSGKSGQAR